MGCAGFGQGTPGNLAPALPLPPRVPKRTSMILQTAFLSLFLWPVLATSGWLGVYLADSETEVRIAEVIPGSPAEKSGLRAGDVILELNGEGGLTIEAFVARVQRHAAGDRVRLKVRRGETELEIQVRLAPRAEVLGQAPQAEPRQQGNAEQIGDAVPGEQIDPASEEPTGGRRR